MYEDDGVDPRLVDKNIYRVKRNHREQRLCKQIAGVLSIILSGACCDERLCALGIKSVEPAPDTTCLRVTVFPLYNDPRLNPEEIILLLKSAKSYIRKEVATEISRRRIPDFTFRVIVDPDYFILK
jgi:ribosome-binding factor A